MVKPQPPDRDSRKTLSDRLAKSNLYRVLSYSDFRLLWIGAFLSFTGSWVQNVAQGYFVYQLTGDESKLGFVSFCSSVPVFIFGFVAGTLADAFNKRTVLIVTQAIFAIGALYLAIATQYRFVQYWQIVTVAFLLGLVSCVEMPTRQSVVSRVVPADDLAAAVPVNAMTFNVARIFGPALGGLLLAHFGVATCYLLNGISFIALIWAAMAIKADLTSRPRSPQPIRDLITEGYLYTMHDRRLRTLFILETVTAGFGLAYMPLLPAFVHQILGIAGQEDAKRSLGSAFTAVGVGAFIGLLLVTQYSESHRKANIIRGSMWVIGIGLILLSVARVPIFAFPVLSCLGAAAVAQLNTTNALFQLMSPERLRGRVLAMHIWALNGFSPFGVLFFGWLANRTRTNHNFTWQGVVHTLPSHGVALSMQLGGICVLVGALAATLSKRGLSGLA
ncbi:MAG: MFS transporter [Fimbriimonas sp.]|nr:MFS transporter [Fimbriimonas sp.]